MEIIEIIIENISIENDKFVMESNENKYYGLIKKGCIKFDLVDEDENNISLDKLKNGVRIILTIKNNIIQKIVIPNNWIIYSDVDSEIFEN